MVLLNRKIAGSYFSNRKKIGRRKISRGFSLISTDPKIRVHPRKSAANVFDLLPEQIPIACFITCPRLAKSK